MRGTRFAAAFALALAMGTGVCGAQTASLSAEAPRAYSFSRASVKHQAGMKGELLLFGRSPGGAESLVARALCGGERALSLSYYHDGSLAALRIEGRDTAGRSFEAVAVLAEASRPQATEEWPQAAYAAAFPLPGSGRRSDRPRGSRAAGFELEPGGPERAARQADAGPCAPRPSWWPALALCGWLALAAGLAAAPAAGPARAGTGYRRNAFLGAAFASAGVLAALALLVWARPAGEVAIVGNAEAGGLFTERTPEDAGDSAGYRLRLWSSVAPALPEGPGPDYLAIRARLGASVPLAAFGAYASLVFSESVLVSRGSDGMERLAGGRDLSAWGWTR